MPRLGCKVPQTNHCTVPQCPYGPHVRKKKDGEDVCAVQQDTILQPSSSRLTPLVLQMVFLLVQEPWAPVGLKPDCCIWGTGHSTSMRTKSFACFSAEQRGEYLLHRSCVAVLLFCLHPYLLLECYFLPGRVSRFRSERIWSLAGMFSSTAERTWNTWHSPIYTQPGTFNGTQGIKWPNCKPFPPTLLPFFIFYKCTFEHAVHRYFLPSFVSLFLTCDSLGSNWKKIVLHHLLRFLAGFF